GWGEGSNQLKNRNFDSSMIAHPLPGPPPLRTLARPAGEGVYRRYSRICFYSHTPKASDKARR
ncbi:hypothetical protein, partial [Cardiobacterium hominis]|uniref:hypothetical protein n=1 Tax=Cardiobacterium hominis TaxID=2718 RepID=UPI0028D3EF85